MQYAMIIIITLTIFYWIIWFFPHKNMPLSMVRVFRYIMPKASKDAYTETLKIESLNDWNYNKILNEVKQRGFVTSLEFTVLHHRRLKEIEIELKRREALKSFDTSKPPFYGKKSEK